MTAPCTLVCPEPLTDAASFCVPSAPLIQAGARRLRDYQLEAADAVHAAFSRGVEGPAVVLPTGSGKTSVIAELARREVVVGGRVLLLAHRNELIEQMADATTAVNPAGPIPAKVGGPHHGDLNAQIVSATVQSLQRISTLIALGRRDLVIVDECFAAGTLVDGRPIETLQVGDRVTAVSRSGEVTDRAVTAVMRSVPSGLVRIHLSDGQLITCTPGHPFLTSAGWRAAGDLSEGALLHHARLRQTCGRGQRQPGNETSETARRGVGVGYRGGDCFEGRGNTALLQRGHRMAGVEDRSGSGRTVSRYCAAAESGPAQGRSTVGYRVDRVEVLQPGSDGTYGGLCPGGVVYNLEVDVDHTYTVGNGVVVHNCHHAVASTYLKVLDHFTQLGGRRTGFTATMTRLAPTKNEPPLRRVWNEVVFERDVVWAIENGFLLPPHGVTVQLPDLDVGTLHTGSGDITDVEAAEAMMRDTTLNGTVAAVTERTGALSTIVFGASMDHCRQLAESLAGLGVSAEVVVGPTSVRERTGIYRRFRNGQTRVLVTVDVLTEGADFPRCEAVVLARPTHSQSRLVQCVGRALRPHTFEDGRVKERALVVDLVGAGSLGLIVQTKLDPERREKPDEDEGLGCDCPQPCIGEPCDLTCTGIGCDCACRCNVAEETAEREPAVSLECTCQCALAFGLCRCGCECETHRIDELEVFDPITGERTHRPLRRTDTVWSRRTATIRWTIHPRGLVRPIYRQTGSKGVLMLADMRGITGTAPGTDWAFGFYDTTARAMFWVNTTGQWQSPGPTCYLQGFSLADADRLANHIFDGHMRDTDRREASSAQVNFARALGVPDAHTLDTRDLADMLALAHADKWMPNFGDPSTGLETSN